MRQRHPLECRSHERRRPVAVCRVQPSSSSIPCPAAERQNVRPSPPGCRPGISNQRCARGLSFAPFLPAAFFCFLPRQRSAGNGGPAQLRDRARRGSSRAVSAFSFALEKPGKSDLVGRVLPPAMRHQLRRGTGCFCDDGPRTVFVLLGPRLNPVDRRRSQSRAQAIQPWPASAS